MFGSNLIPTALLIIILGFFFGVAGKLYTNYQGLEQEEITDNRIEKIQETLIDYYTFNGRYPCPARFDSGLDSATFGVEVSNCVLDQDGIVVNPGFTDNTIATGFVPVRTLGLADEEGFDGWRKRIAYTISAGFTPQNIDNVQGQAQIKLTDQNGTNATEEVGNVIFTLAAFRDVDAGAYTVNGNLVAPCGTGTGVSEVCDFDNVVTRNNQRSDANLAADNNNVKVSYHVNKRCNSSGSFPKGVGFLLDTSGSMGSRASCPPGRSGKCNRMDLALWALHRAIYARQAQTKGMENVFSGYTGFTKNSSTSGATKSVKGGNFEILNTVDDSETAQQQALTSMENKIYKACPSGGTPLGVHIGAIANILNEQKAKIDLAEGTTDEDETYEDRSKVPYVITIVTDGNSNSGTSPLAIAQSIAKNNPHIKINAIDVGNNTDLKKVAELTGGQYLRTNNPDKLLEALYESLGLCNKPINYPDVVDRRQCSK